MPVIHVRTRFTPIPKPSTWSVDMLCRFGPYLHACRTSKSVFLHTAGLFTRRAASSDRITVPTLQRLVFHFELRESSWPIESSALTVSMREPSLKNLFSIYPAIRLLVAISRHVIRPMEPLASIAQSLRRANANV